MKHVIAIVLSVVAALIAAYVGFFASLILILALAAFIEKFVTPMGAGFMLFGVFGVFFGGLLGILAGAMTLKTVYKRLQKMMLF